MQLNQTQIKLSPREAQVANLACHGLQNKEIAAQLGISINTVKTVLSEIFDALGFENRMELSLWSQQNPEGLQCQWVSSGWTRKVPWTAPAFIRPAGLLVAS
jgi:DNA-binding CsgD family transcriptional regulator